MFSNGAGNSTETELSCNKSTKLNDDLVTRTDDSRLDRLLRIAKFSLLIFTVRKRFRAFAETSLRHGRGLFWKYLRTRVLQFWLISGDIKFYHHFSEDTMDINKLVEVLRGTLQPDQREQAEKHLAEVNRCPKLPTRRWPVCQMWGKMRSVTQ